MVSIDAHILPQHVKVRPRVTIGRLTVPGTWRAPPHSLPVDMYHYYVATGASNTMASIDAHIAPQHMGYTP